MVLILPEYSQRPYRYGMTLLCIGAMFNWLGLAENNAEPVRYIGVTLIAAGAMLICLAMCFWMKASHDPNESSQSDEPVHHIVTIHQSGESMEKPPDYDSVTGCLPPCYEDAIRLSPSLLLTNISTVHDVTDCSRKQEVIEPSSSPQDTENIPAPPYSLSCAVTINDNSTLAKREDVSKSTVSAALPSPNEPLPEESSQITSSQTSDNFGSRVLRLSKRLLRGRPRVGSQDGQSSTDIAPIHGVSSISNGIGPGLTNQIATVNENSTPSTSNLPVR